MIRSYRPPWSTRCTTNRHACRFQFTAQQLWEQRDRDKELLLRSAYEAMGGVEGPRATCRRSARRAEPQDTKVARQLLVRLVTRNTRGAWSCSKMLSTAWATAPLLSWIGWTSARLVTARKVRGSAEPKSTVELVHESLIGRWVTLRRWLDEDKEEHVVLAEAGQAAALWTKRGRREEGLWRGEALAEATRVLSRLDNVPQKTRDFIEAAVAVSQRRTRLIRTAIAATVIGLSVIATAFALQSRAATKQKQLAELRETQALVLGARTALLRKDMLEARGTLRHIAEASESIPLMARATWVGVKAQPRGRFDLAAPTAPWLRCSQEANASPSSNETPRCTWWSTTPDKFARFMARTATRPWPSCRAGKASSRARKRASSANGSWGKIDRCAWRRSAKPTSSRSPYVQTERASSFVKKEALFRSSRGGKADPRPRRDGLHENANFTLTPDGQSVWVSRDTQLERWQITPAKLVQTIKHADPAHAALRHVAGWQTLASARNDGAVQLYDATDGSPTKRLATSGGRVSWIGFDSTAKHIARQITGRGYELREIASGRTGFIPTTSLYTSLDWSDPSGRMYFGAGPALKAFDGRNLVRRAESVSGHDDILWASSFSHDSAWLATGGADKRVLIWDVMTGRIRAQQQSVGHKVTALAFAPQSRRLAIGGVNREIGIWDFRSDGLVRRYQPRSRSRTQVCPRRSDPLRRNQRRKGLRLDHGRRGPCTPGCRLHGLVHVLCRAPARENLGGSWSDRQRTSESDRSQNGPNRKELRPERRRRCTRTGL